MRTVDAKTADKTAMEGHIVDVLRERDNATYVVANILRDKYHNMTTAIARRRLERLAKDGVVERKPNPYSDYHLQWGIKT